MSVKQLFRWASYAAVTALVTICSAPLVLAVDPAVWFQLIIWTFACTVLLAWCSISGIRILWICACAFSFSAAAFILSQAFAIPFTRMTFSVDLGLQFFNIPILFIILIPLVCLTTVTVLVTDNEDVFDWIFDAGILSTLILAALDAVFVQQGFERFSVVTWPIIGIPFFHLIGVFVVSCLICTVIIIFIRKVIDVKALEIVQVVALLALLCSYGVTAIRRALLLPSLVCFLVSFFLIARIFTHYRRRPR